MKDTLDPIRRLLDISSDDAIALSTLEAGYAHLDRRLPSIALLKTLWSYIKWLLGVQGFLTLTPIWRNTYCRELLKLKGFRDWEASGLQFLSQLYNGPVLKSFLEVQAEFGIPRTNFFKYLQMRHALQMQSRLTPLRLTDHAIVQGILMENEKKGMIPRGYNIILNALQDPASLPCRRKWVEDVGPLDGEMWSLCLASAPVVSVSASQKLSQRYLLHRAYRMPARLHRWGLRDTPLCPKCKRDHGDLLHMFWKCPKLFRIGPGF